jgi:hypothetical protein
MRYQFAAEALPLSSWVDAEPGQVPVREFWMGFVVGEES